MFPTQPPDIPSFLINLLCLFQWLEESFTNFGKGINWRSYVVCDVAYHNVNNWLWSPFIDRGPANRLYIEIQFTIRDCSLFPGNTLSCKETFSLLYYEFDAATREPPPWQPDSYKLISRIAAGGEGRFNQNSDVDINTEVKSIPVTKKGVYFAFRDQGACISILAVKVYYITCPAIRVNFANFNETPTGREIIEQQTGVCVENSETIDNQTPTYLCKGDGKWSILNGGCRCKVGYEPDFEKQTCNGECDNDNDKGINVMSTRGGYLYFTTGKEGEQDEEIAEKVKKQKINFLCNPATGIEFEIEQR